MGFIAKKQQKSGFTLLEFVLITGLVVLALLIIGLSLGNRLTKSRDMKRLSHMEEISTALNAYEARNKKFPVLPEKTVITGSDDLARALEGDLILKITPIDPLHPTYSYSYISNENGSDYTLTFCLETSALRGYKKGCANEVKP